VCYHVQDVGRLNNILMVLFFYDKCSSRKYLSTFTKVFNCVQCKKVVNRKR
jgi:hypothetical protein